MTRSIATRGYISLSMGLLATLLLAGHAMAADVPGWEAFVIRQDAGNNDPQINDVTVGSTDAKEFIIDAGSMKAGWGTNNFNGLTVKDITRVAIERLDDESRFTAGSGPAVAPYFNIWITDGEGNYAVIANEPSNPAFQALYNDGYDLSFSDISDKVAKAYENSDMSWLPNGGSGMTFADLADYAIQAPSVAELTAGWSGLGSGAPRELGTNLAYGFNWVFGDTLSNYVSGDPGYVVANPLTSEINTHIAYPDQVPDDGEELPRANFDDYPTGFADHSWKGPASGKSNWHARYLSDGDYLSDVFPNHAATLTLADIASIRYSTKRDASIPAARDWWIQIYTRPDGIDDSTSGWYGLRFINNYNEHGTGTGAWQEWSTDSGMTFQENSNAPAPGGLMSFDDIKTTYGGELIEMISVQTDSSWDGFDGNIDGLVVTLTDGTVGVVNFEVNDPTLTLAAQDTCLMVNDTLTVNIDMADPGDFVVGGQFFLEYNDSILTLVSADPGDAPFAEFFEDTSTLGQIDYAVNASPSGDPGTMDDATLAILTFTVDAEVCDASDLVTFRTHTPPTRLTKEGGEAINPVLVAIDDISVDSTAPVISCPADVVADCSDSTDPPATGVATATDTCDTAPTVTYADDRSGLTGCNSTGAIIRTWTATDCSGNTITCDQTITLEDNQAPVMTACPADITVNAEAGTCDATVTYTPPTATDTCYSEGFEDPGFVSVSTPSIPSVSWNDYYSMLTRVLSGTDGIPSKSGVAHGVIDSTGVGATGAFTRLRGYDDSFNDGFKTSLDVYMDLSDPAVAADTYGWDLTTAATQQDGSHLQDFIFHTASNASGEILVAGSNNTNFTRRNDLTTLNHYAITSSGWYTFEWDFRDDGGVLAVDMNLRDSSGTLLWTETRTDAGNLIATVVGGHRYMWFTFLEVDKLAIDNTQLIRNIPVSCVQASGTSFSSGTTTVTCSATDECGNTEECTFDVTVNPVNDLVVDLELESVNEPTLTRCITFELWDCNAASPAAIEVKEELTFTNGVASGAVIEVPCGAYTCITARDELHTLRRTLSTLPTSGTQYVADFVAAGKPLLGGNLNDDFWVDILDFGVFTGQYGASYGLSGDTTCSTPMPHADISGDNLVDSVEFTYIRNNFLKSHEPNCCGASAAPMAMAQSVLREDANGDGGVTVMDLSYVKARLGLEPAGENASADVNGDGGITVRDLSAVKAMIGTTATTQEGPVERISTDELSQRGLDHLIGADLNDDGWLDELDIAAWLQGTRP